MFAKSHNSGLIHCISRISDVLKVIEETCVSIKFVILLYINQIQHNFRNGDLILNNLKPL